jgi:hypothetical protein
MKTAAIIIITVIISSFVSIHLQNSFLDSTSQARIAVLKCEAEEMNRQLAEKDLQISELKKQISQQ